MKNTKSFKKSIAPKCLGCGLQLSNDSNSLAYTNDFSKKYCKRCFQLTHYGKAINQTISKKQTDQVLKQLDIYSKDTICLVMDLLNLDEAFISKFQNNKQLVLIITKCDQWINSKNYQVFKRRFLEWIKVLLDRSVPIFLTSSFNHLGLKQLSEYILKLPLKNKLYWIGKTNSGKSSLINALFSFNDLKNPKLTTSNFINTTIGLNKLKFFKHTFIDTPGFWSEKSLQQSLLVNDIKVFQTKKVLKPIVFQLPTNQSLLFDKLLQIDVTSLQTSSFNCYLNNPQLKIHRTKTSNVQAISKNNAIFKYKINDDIELTTYTWQFNPNQKYNLVIDGLGIICFKRVNQLKIFINKHVKLSILKRNIF